MSVTYLLIGINVIVYFLVAAGMSRIMEIGILMPYRTVRYNSWYELITSGFLHGGLTHLLFNMITLYFFGPALEQTIGKVHFLILYFTGLIASSIPSVIQEKNNPEYATLGASGAVESVIFAFILIYPFTPLYIMFIPIGIPAWIFGILFIAYSVYASKQEGKINHGAHIAGAVWGIVYMIAFVPNALDYLLSFF